MKQWIVILCLVAAGCRTTAIVDTDFMSELAKLDTTALWPRFDARAIPVAIFDGKQTWLYGHPYPPEDFGKVREGVYVRDGRHPAVTANSTAKIEDVLTATLMPMRESLTIDERIGLVVHEVFHAFQQKQHPLWAANEAELFVYPADDAPNLALARLEWQALRRALDARGDDSACWASAAMALRRERFVKLNPSAASYEWQSELNEGLPTYVQHRAAKTPDERVLPKTFEAGSVRQRAYATGHAIARLLDRVSPRWRLDLEQGDIRPLDQLLMAAVAKAPSTCTFTAAERASAQQLAESDAASIRASRANKRAELLSKRGWRIVLTMKSGVLWPQGFDPLNVHVVAPDEILHTRHVKLGNEHSVIEILDRTALTVAAGAHPLFNGVKSVTVTGLQEKPVMEEGGEFVTLRADGVQARLKAADVAVALTNDER